MTNSTDDQATLTKLSGNTAHPKATSGAHCDDMCKTEKFIQNPYVQGAYIRENIYLVQFSVYLELEIALLDNDQVSTYTRYQRHFVGRASTVSEAIDVANLFFDNTYSDNGFDDIARGYISSEDRLEWSKDLSIEIYDRAHKLVLGGTFGDCIAVWEKPLTSCIDITQVETVIQSLLSEASYEAGWDNYSTAKSLRKKAYQYSWKIPASTVTRAPYFNQEIEGRSDFIVSKI